MDIRSITAALLALGIVALGSPALADAAQPQKSAQATDAASAAVEFEYVDHVMLPQYYDALTEQQQAMAMNIADAVENHIEEIDSDGMDTNEVIAAWFAFANSDPVKHFLKDFEVDEKAGRIKLIFHTDAQTQAEQLAAFKQKICEIMDECLVPGDDAATSMNMFRYVVLNTEYAQEEHDAGSLAMFGLDVYGIVTDGRGVCEQMSGLYNFLLQQAGIDCLAVSNTFAAIENGGELHAWSMVGLDGRYYHVDPTFANSLYKMNGNEEAIFMYYGMSDALRAESLDGPYIVMKTQEYDDTDDAAPECPECIPGNEWVDNYVAEPDDSLIGD